MADKDFPLLQMRVEVLKGYLVEAPRFFETKDGDKLMSCSFIKNPDPKALDKDGDKKYVSFRVTTVVNVSKAPWKAKAQKGDPVFVSAENADLRLYESTSEKATLGVGVEMEIRWPSRFELLVSKEELDSREDPDTDEEPAAKPRKKLGVKKAKKEPVAEPEDDDNDLPEGLDD